jgi:hypothetical protein
MRLAVVLVLLASGCASVVDVPALDEFQCRPPAGGPDCNGDRRRDECSSLGLPDAYGVDVACRRPVRRVDGECRERWQGTYRCEAHGDLLCCYGP